MHTMRGSLDESYTLSILRSTFYLCTEISGGFAEVSEHEASVRTTRARGTRATRSNQRAPCHASEIMFGKLWLPDCLYLLTVSQMTNRKVYLLFC